MKSLRNWCTGHWPVHSFQRKIGLTAALTAGAAALLVPAPAIAQAAPVPSAVSVAQSAAGQSVADFYKARQGAPLWLSPAAGDAAQQLIYLLSSANIDGLDPAKYQPAMLETEFQRARAKNKRKDVQRAEQALSQAFAAYVDDLRQDPGVGSAQPLPLGRGSPVSHPSHFHVRLFALGTRAT